MGLSSWTSDPTPGKESASSTHARSTVLAAASLNIPRHASTNLPNAASFVTAATTTSSAASAVCPSLYVASMARRMISRAIFCADSHRLNGSESCASWNRSSSAPSGGSIVSRTGALKPRRTEGTGSASTPVNVNVAAVSLRRRTTDPASPGHGTHVDVDPGEVTVTTPDDTSRSLPVDASTSPTLTGMSCAALAPSPPVSGVLGRTCVSVSE